MKDAAYQIVAGKGATIREAAIEDVVELSDTVALTIVRTAFTEGDDHRYAVPVMLTSSARAGELEATAPGTMIADLDVPKGRADDIVRRVYEGIEAGEHEVLADDTAVWAKSTLSRPVLEQYPQLAAS